MGAQAQVGQIGRPKLQDSRQIPRQKCKFDAILLCCQSALCIAISVALSNRFGLVFAGPLAQGVLDNTNNPQFLFPPPLIPSPRAVLEPRAGESWLRCGFVVASLCWADECRGLLDPSRALLEAVPVFDHFLIFLGVNF